MDGIGVLEQSTCRKLARWLARETSLGKELQEKCLRNVCPESPVKHYCCYIVIMILTVAVIVLSIALSVNKENIAISRPGPYYSTCPNDWIGFRNKCFYFSEDVRNWTFSQTYCTALEAHLALFDSLEELNFLKRYKGASDHWIGLHRESPEHPWTWTDNTEYNNLFLTQGSRECAYLNNSGISSAKDYTLKKWICSKYSRYTLQHPEIFNPG
ncbi:C-type lectin domain family 2 member E-like [Arvicola amphibius]|uniref:C-type lectin domain family 2 member E-like n=1 Tax=Arvicola amphibius TaxID=1047088 RepID=UPI0018E386C1|nr:C-type lectin domain family 2 member E-like [Arvicola amphibius]